MQCFYYGTNSIRPECAWIQEPLMEISMYIDVYGLDYLLWNSIPNNKRCWFRCNFIWHHKFGSCTNASCLMESELPFLPWNKTPDHIMSLQKCWEQIIWVNEDYRYTANTYQLNCIFIVVCNGDKSIPVATLLYLMLKRHKHSVWLKSVDIEA